MTQIALHPHSILMKAPLLLVNDVPEWGIRTPSDQQELADDLLYITKSNDRLPLVAHYVYGDVRLWWAIYDYNRTVLGDAYPLFIPAGLTLRIPPKDRVLAEINNV
jgi:nucleoid-associated protein YgaU